MPVAKKGGYMARPDHSVPPDVSFGAFQEYKKARRINVRR